MPLQAARKTAKRTALVRALTRVFAHSRSGRMLPDVETCTIAAAFALALTAAILTLPDGGAQLLQDGRALLLLQSSPEWLIDAGAIGEHFPLSP